MTAVVLVAAAAVGSPVLGWMAAAACVALALVTLVNHALLIASDRPAQERGRTALRALRWLAVTSAALAGALILQATVSAAGGAVLAAVALLALLVAAAAFFLHW